MSPHTLSRLQSGGGGSVVVLSWKGNSCQAKEEEQVTLCTFEEAWAEYTTVWANSQETQVRPRLVAEAVGAVRLHGRVQRGVATQVENESKV